MSAFNLQISYPINVNGSDQSVLLSQSINETLHVFDTLRWRQYRILQLQMHGSKTSIKISNLQMEHSLNINLLTTSESGNVEVSIDSDITTFTSKKDMFGLLNRKIKHYIRFERLELPQARHYLALFLANQLQDLELAYKEKSLKKESII